MKNKNYVGGAIYFEPHVKYSEFTGRLSNVLSLYNWSDDDGSFVYLSPGLFSAEFLVESSFFYSNRAIGCNFFYLFEINLRRRAICYDCLLFQNVFHD